PVTEQSLVGFYRSAQIDGLVLMHIHARDWRVEVLRQSNYPFVMIGRCADSTGLNFIDLDFEAAVTVAFNHLVELGHRNIGFLALPVEMHLSGYGPAARAWQGYEQALVTHDIPPLFREVGYNAQEIVEATLDLLEEQPDLTAIVTVHEFASLSIIQALKSQG